MANAVLELNNALGMVTCKIDNLSYLVQNYGSIIYKLWKWDGYSWVVQETYYGSGSEYNGIYYAWHNFTGQEPGVYYYPEIFVNYGGTWYPGDPAYATGYTAAYGQAPSIPAAIFTNASTQKTTVTFDYLNTLTAMNLYTYNGTAWDLVTTVHAGHYTNTAITGGRRITITNLQPGITYYFHVKTYVGSYFSTSVTQVSTTGAMPTIPAKPTVNSRFDQGVALDCGDHGYESSGFQYGLTVDNVGYYIYDYHLNMGWLTYDYSVYHTYRACSVKYGYNIAGVYGLVVGTNTLASFIVSAPKKPTSVAVNSRTTSSISLTATVVDFTSMEWRYRVLGSGGSFISATDYSGDSSYTITGLAMNTTYEIQVYTIYDSVYSVNNYNFSATTLNQQLAQPTLSSSSYTSKSITYACATVANATWYDVTLKKAGVYQANNAGSTPSSNTFDNLIHNTAYTVTITVSASGWTDNSYTYNFTTSNLTVGSPTNVSVQQAESSLSVDIKYSWGTNATSMDYRWGTDGATWNTYSSQSNNLYPSVNYNTGVGSIGNKYFQARSVRSDGYNTIYSSWVNATPYPVTVVAVNLRPSNFAWTTTITQGGNIYSTDLANKTLYIITASEWNALTTKINLFRVYKGLGNYSFTTVSSGTTITKAIVNEAITAITAITSRSINPPTTLITGDIINNASLYAGLRDSVNSTT